MPNPKALLVLLTSVSLLSSAPASATSPYRLEPSREYVWLGGGLAMGVVGLLAVSQMDPLTEAEVAALDVNDINSFDRDRMKGYYEDHTGDALALASYLLPLSLLARSDARADFRTIGVMWVEATMVNGALLAVAKPLVERTRPYAYDPEVPLEKKLQNNVKASFYSGHTASAAVNSFFLATVISDYTDNRTLEIAAWSGAIAYPAVTGFFRVDSGHHFTTDVLAGYAVGATVGWLVPYLHRRPDDGLSFDPLLIDGNPGLSMTVSF